MVKEDDKEVLLFTPHGFLDLNSEYIRKKVQKTLESKKYSIIIMSLTEQILITEIKDDCVLLHQICKNETGKVINKTSQTAFEDVIDLISKHAEQENVTVAVADIIFDLVKFQLAVTQVLPTNLNKELADKVRLNKPDVYIKMNNLDKYLNIILK